MSRRWVFSGVLMAAAVVIGYAMISSLTPASHPDHDHALESIDAGGFLRVQGWNGKRRNLVGRPGRVLVLHWFALDSQTAIAEMPALLAFARAQANNPRIEIVLMAAEASWDQLRQWAGEASVPRDRLYLDPGLATGRQFGVQRIPETLIYEPSGRLAHQARGALDWASPAVRQQILAFGESAR
jgi:hypothetical protein